MFPVSTVLPVEEADTLTTLYKADCLHVSDPQYLTTQ
jgi:hypothetical protein